MQNVLIADYVHHHLVEGLRGLGIHVLYAPEIEASEMAQWLPAFEGIIVNTKTPVRSALITANPQLRFVGRLGVGLDIIDTDVAEAHGIHVRNTPGANANAVAEHCMGMLLALLRNIPRANAEVKSGLWLREDNRGIELTGQTIGIIGFGNTGSAFASRFAGWLTPIVSYDKYKTHYADDLRFVEEGSLEAVLRQSDIISLHVPLTGETHHMVDRAFLQACKHGVILINASRGEVVDTAALVDALKSGEVAGACLDVLDSENPEGRTPEAKRLYQQLFEMDRVIMSPHIAGWTWASKRNIAEQMLKAIEGLKTL